MTRLPAKLIPSHFDCVRGYENRNLDGLLQSSFSPWWSSEISSLRVMVEHRLARLVQLGIRQARYCGRAKTKFQLYLAATVTNLTLLTDKMGLTGDLDPELPVFNAVAHPDIDCSANQRGNLAWALVCLTWAFLPPLLFPKHTFRPNF